MAAPDRDGALLLGRYILFDEIASGGMATVHLGRLLGPAGFTRTVAIKRMHPHFAKEPDFVSMFLNEARLASRIQHPNVVSTLDVIAEERELLLVMEYVAGESFSKLLRAAAQGGSLVDPALVSSIIAGALHGLHAAHEACDAMGEPLRVVHRDVSPQNILVGVDGVARVLDFGVAKAAMHLQTTRQGQMKGKIAYMAPEQLRGGPIDRRADIFAAGIVHWEALTGRRLFPGVDVGEVTGRVLSGAIAPPSAMVSDLPDDVDDVVMRALERDPARRYATAREYAIAVENTAPMMLTRRVGEWVQQIGGEILRSRAERVAALERLAPPPSLVPATGPALAVTSAVTAAALPSRSRRWKQVWMIPIVLVLTAAAGSWWALGTSIPPGVTKHHGQPASSADPPILTPPSSPAAKPEPAVLGPSPAAMVGAEKESSSPKSPARSSARRRRNCDPPYVLDARGIRRVRHGCT